MKFHKMIKELRENEGLTQGEISNKLGIPRTTYAKWENDVEPEYEWIIKIANYYKVSCGYLLTGENNQNTTKETLLLTKTESGGHKLLDVTHDKYIQEFVEKFMKVKDRSAIMRFINMTLEDEQAAVLEEAN